MGVGAGEEGREFCALAKSLMNSEKTLRSMFLARLTRRNQSLTEAQLTTAFTSCLSDGSTRAWRGKRYGKIEEHMLQLRVALVLRYVTVIFEPVAN